MHKAKVREIRAMRFSCQLILPYLRWISNLAEIGCGILQDLVWNLSCIFFQKGTPPSEWPLPRHGLGVPRTSPCPGAAVGCAKCICQPAWIGLSCLLALTNTPSIKQLSRPALVRGALHLLEHLWKYKKKRCIFNSGCLMYEYVLHTGLVATFSWPYFHLLMQLTPRACWQGGWLWDRRLKLSKLNFRITEK